MNKPENDWVHIDEIYRFIIKNLMTNNPQFVLQNWDHKYINIRVDMRSGMARMTAGNKYE